ncbi:MAG: dihydropteroate synthase [Burkholderiaceae bacterium]|nr:MAG: dihydropteroate synthase [Burkholderiaceae bacterium]
MFRCGKYTFDLHRPLIMGVVNVTPDSFSDGGQFFSATAAIEHALQLVEEGADILDIGGESSRPGAAPVSLAEELQRILPVIEGLNQIRVPLSIDTYKPEVMRAALDAGASMVNDIWALRQPGALEAVAERDCGLCLMHMQRDPQQMQQAPHYADVVREVHEFLRMRVQVLRDHGVAAERLVIDPGFGFGKTLEHNLALLRQLELFSDLGVPVLAGLSRKSMIAQLTGRERAEQRLAGSLSATLTAVARGAKIVRVHDVAATRDALAVWQAIEVKSER